MPKLVDIVRQFVLGRGLWVEHAVADEQIRGLIKRLRPASNRKGLIRVGPQRDGGYLMPDDLEGIELCISPGVSNEVGFDEAIAERGITVLMADASVNKPPKQHDRFQFIKKYIGVKTEGDYVRLDDLVGNAQIAPNSDILLQMDIEGAEWQVMLDLSDAVLKRIRVAVIEAHGLDDMFSRSGIRRIESFFDKMSRFHEIVHIHPNNVTGTMRRGDIEVPRLMEFTFYRRDRDHFDPTAPTLARHPLDADNVARRRSLDLPPIWRQ